MIKKRFRSFLYAFYGIRIGFRTQIHIKLHVAAAFLVVVLGVLFEVSRLEWALLFLSMGLVISAEYLNTALEWLTDMVSPAYHPLAGQVKDAAAAAVLVAAAAAALVGLIVFWPYFEKYF